MHSETIFNLGELVRQMDNWTGLLFFILLKIAFGQLTAQRVYIHNLRLL
jgi:hypothetical protein